MLFNQAGICVKNLGCSASPLWLLYWSRDLMIPPIRAQICPPQNSIGRQSRVCQARCELLCFACESLDDFFHLWSNGMCSDRFKLAIPRFHVWYSNEELTTALYVSARAGACYVACRPESGIIKSRRDSNTSLILTKQGLYFPSRATQRPGLNWSDSKS
jgi:hypothetical protein